MTNEQAINGNKAIGRFLGYKMLPNGRGILEKYNLDFNELNHSGCPCYHDNFSWLIKVWVAIGEIRKLNQTDAAKIFIDEMSIGSGGTYIKAYGKTVQEKFSSFEIIEECGEGNENFTNKNLLDCVYKVCVEFILWYEKQ